MAVTELIFQRNQIGFDRSPPHRCRGTIQTRGVVFQMKPLLSYRNVIE